MARNVQRLFAVVAALETSVLAAPRPGQGWSPGHHSGSSYQLSVSGTSPYGLEVTSGSDVIVSNPAILAGGSNNSVQAVSASNSGQIANSGGRITAAFLESNVVKVQVNTTESYIGAQFSTSADANFYGVWEYPWFQGLNNANVSFDLKGLGDSEGINWDNARAPFFFTNAGYGVYTDTLDMGSYNFTTPGQAEFIFNSSSLVYYIILPSAPGDYKSILETYTSLSSRIEMPPDSGYGPTFWSDDFEEDFHAGVTNAQENYYDVINHLYYNQIHASSMFADRPYGTGNMSFGNFDFDPVYYPTPEQFIANLSTWGFDFQVWAANRAFLDTELYNVSEANGWLFPGISPEFFPGPALNLSIPEAYDYFKQRMAYFPSVGVKGYKIDRGEEGEMPVYEQNIQMTLFEQLCYETMVEHWNSSSSFYDFARSAIDRSRSRTYIWNGDSHSNFSGLAHSVTSGIRAGLVGFPVWASDTGGYIRDLDDPAQELWARWMWFSAFSPVFEIMIGTNHTPWYPPYTSELVDVLKTTANLHHDLIPYIKSYTYAASRTGVPIMRAAFLEASGDGNAFDVTDAYFFGAELFIAPVVSAGGQRSVYFPDQPRRYLDYFDKTTVHAPGSTVVASLDVHSVPAYVLEGGIVPRGDIVQANNKWTEDWMPELTIEIYPSFEVPESGFEYFNGDAGNVVEICVKTSRTQGQEGKNGQGTVEIVYGDLDIGGRFSIFTSAGVRNVTIVSGGGRAVVDGVGSLFE